MNKAVLATLCFATGSVLGFIVGYNLNKKEQEKDIQYVDPIVVDKKEDDKPEEKPNLEGQILSQGLIKPAKLASPGEVGINYTEFVKELKYKQETTGPSEDDEYDSGEEDSEGGEEELVDASQFEETYEERVEREAEEALKHSEEYKREHKGKIELMTSDEWDTDFPETDYEREDLYYFTESDILTDEDGHQLNEKEFIGPKVRQVGWMQSPDEMIFVRNHPKEKEYRVFKEQCSVEEWF